MTTALLVIDVQESFRARDSWREASAPDIAARVGRLVEHARDTGREVVWILHTEPGTGTTFDPESGHVRLIDGLEPLGTEPVLYKTSHNAFTTTNLGQYLTSKGVTAWSPRASAPSNAARPQPGSPVTWGIACDSCSTRP